MSEVDAPEAVAAVPTEPAARPRRPMRNLKRSTLDPAIITRQMAVTTEAFRLLGSAEAARDYLNTPDEALGGRRRIDIAGESADGLAEVMAGLAAQPDR